MSPTDSMRPDATPHAASTETTLVSWSVRVFAVLALVLLTVTALGGCRDIDKESTVPFEPPLLKERNISDVVRTLQGPMVVPFEGLTGMVPANFAGITMNSGDNRVHVNVDAELAEGQRLAVAFYGPRSELGFWGEALDATADGDGQIDLDIDLPGAGRYLLIVGTVSGQPAGTFQVSVTCDGPCEAPPTVDPDCPETSDCTLSCALGFVVDEKGCQTCACITECVDELDCPDGEVCGDDGLCSPECQCSTQYAPVCGDDGVTYANQCEASCAGVEVVSNEACATMCPELACAAPCPYGHVVDADGCPTCECQSPCASCPNTWAPVCSTNQRTHLNACHAECAGEVVAYLGACRNECAPIECPGLACGSNGFKLDAEGCPTCACQPSPKCDQEARVCVEGGGTLPSECAADEQQVAIVYEGTCPRHTCTDETQCPTGSECVKPAADTPCLQGDGEACVGVCLRRQTCDAMVPDACPLSWTCVDSRCQSNCMCSSRYDPVCGTDGVTWDNACVAACAGASIARLGPCCPSVDACALDCPAGLKTDANECAICECRDEPACTCTDVESPVCATNEDGVAVTFQNRCLAECEGLVDIVDGACTAP